MAETMIDTGVTIPEVSEQDAAVQAQTDTTALDEFMEQAIAKSTDEQTEQTTEPNEQAQDSNNVSKGIKGRIQAAEAKADRAGYDRGMQEAKAKYEAEIAGYKQQMAEYSEWKLNQEAEALAKEEHCSVALAKRILAAEKGVVLQSKANTNTANTAPKNATVAPQETGISTERKAMLTAQMNTLKDNYGIDVFAEGVLTEEEARDIAQGKTDFNTVALRIMSEGKVTKSAPAPVRSGGNRENHGKYDFSTMTDAELDAFNERIRTGHSYKPR